MIRNPLMIDKPSFIRLLVYSIVAALTIWIGLVLIAANLWHLKIHLTMRHLLPTFEIQEMYQKLYEPLRFAVISYFAITSGVSIYTQWSARTGLNQFALEKKYVIHFITLLTQSILLVAMFHHLPQERLWLLGSILLISITFFISLKYEQPRRILNSLPSNRV